MKIKLFYSYSHKDAQFRNKIEERLNMLTHHYKRESIQLIQWYDKNRPPGQPILNGIEEKLKSSHLYIFLFSWDFINSKPCKKEWEDVKKLSEERHIYRIPVILHECPWQDFVGTDDVRALPDNVETGLQSSDPTEENKNLCQVYDGVKNAIEDYRKSYTPKNEFLIDLKKTNFISQNNLSIEEIFVFPSLVIDKDNKENLSEDIIKDCDRILAQNYAIVRGEENSGKTTLCKYLTLHLINNNQPVIYINLSEIESKKPNDDLFKKYYEEQFDGDYSLWMKQEKKTIIFDELTNSKNRKKHILYAKKLFSRVVVSAASNQYDSYFFDDEELSDFIPVRIKELSNVKTEELIKKRLRIINYEKIDIAEKKINEILTKGLIERSPFHILSILQTFEGYMPTNLKITSYGHCYRALISAYLIKSGISNSDSELNPCFNFLEHLAFAIFSKKPYDNFIKDYDEVYVIKKTLINKLTSNNDITPLIQNESFSQNYTYYFFLGSYLAKHHEEHKKDIEKLVKENYVKDNNRILLFILHHAFNYDFIENILLESLCAFDNIPEATLSLDETKYISENIAKILPKNIQSNKSISEERRLEREEKDKAERKKGNKKTDTYDGNMESVNNMYKILKNNELLGQVLRNHHGNLERDRLKEIVIIIIGSGLRLVKIFLDKEGIEGLVGFIRSKNKDSDIKNIRQFCQFFCCIMVMYHISKIVRILGVDEIQTIIKDIRLDISPAYELINYFTMLETDTVYSEKEIDVLKALFEKHKDNIFIKKVLSLKTQNYFNTHEVRHDIKQSACSILKISYQGR